MSDWNLLATDLADYLVLHGVPFRKAHEIVGKTVALCLERRCGLADLSLADYKALSPAFERTFGILDTRRSIDARTNPGAPASTSARNWPGGARRCSADFDASRAVAPRGMKMSKVAAMALS